VISTHPSGVMGAAQTDLQNVDMNNADAKSSLVFMSSAYRDKPKLLQLSINELKP